MIFYFTPGGRIGNQLFQYARAYAEASQNELIVFGQMEEFISIFQINRKIVNIKNGLVLKAFERCLFPLLRQLLVKTGLVSSILEIDGIEKRRKGIVDRIKWIEGYFQKASFATPAFIKDIKVKSSFDIAARDFLSRNCVTGSFAFIHVRRGDYLNFEVLGQKDPSLPAEFYLRALKSLGFNAGETTLVLLGDDPCFVEKAAITAGWKTVVSNLAPSADFALMLSADGGVVSNSTFAWWAGKMSGKKIAAPLYWLGWKSSRWYPEGIEDGSFLWVKV